MNLRSSLSLSPGALQTVFCSDWTSSNGPSSVQLPGSAPDSEFGLGFVCKCLTMGKASSLIGIIIRYSQCRELMIAPNACLPSCRIGVHSIFSPLYFNVKLVVSTHLCGETLLSRLCPVTPITLYSRAGSRTPRQSGSAAWECQTQR